MSGKTLTIMAAGLVAGTSALAGLNPARPGLPTVAAASVTTAVGATNPAVTYTAAIPNNQMSAMCVDCHTRAPKPSMGTHYVWAQTNAATNSGGSGIGSARVVAARENAEFFKLSLWNAGGATGAPTYSKYGDAATRTSYVPNNSVAGVKTASSQATLANYAPYEILCESCHNIIINAPGGNNLLESGYNTGAASGTVSYQNVDVARICVDCHGFMYAGGSFSSQTGTYYSDARNTSDLGGRRGNNEYHWVADATGQQTAYAQNHHVMTGDKINSDLASQTLLWTDNRVISYSEAALDNTSTRGTYNVAKAWPGTHPGNGTTAPFKPAAANLSCTNCHAQGHGGDAGEGASLLRGTGLQGTAGVRPAVFSRISDIGRWKQINDLAYCGQCHG